MAKSKHISYISLYKAAGDYCIAKKLPKRVAYQLADFLDWFWKNNKKGGKQ